MKFLLVLLIAGYAKANWQQDIEAIGFFQYFAVYLISSVPRNCPNASQEHVKEEENKAIECIKNIRYNSSFCDTFVNHFKPCIQSLVKETEKCDEPYTFSMKNVVLDSIIEEARFVCDTDGEHILEIMNPCVLTSVHKSDDCRKNITAPMKYTRDITLHCSGFPSLQKCFEDELQHECVNEITKSTVHDLFSVNVKPCNIVMEMFFEIGKYL